MKRWAGRGVTSKHISLTKLLEQNVFLVLESSEKIEMFFLKIIAGSRYVENVLRIEDICWRKCTEVTKLHDHFSSLIRYDMHTNISASHVIVKTVLKPKIYKLCYKYQVIKISRSKSSSKIIVSNINLWKITVISRWLTNETIKCNSIWNDSIFVTS